MRIIRNFSELTAPLPGAVATIGNFDGVHLGHREIFRSVVRKAHAIDGTSVVLTFAPHPLKVLAPERAPRLINTYAEKERLIKASCIDVLISIPFTREVASIPATRFVEEILVGRIGIKHLIIGYDYAFGRNREGNADFLIRMGARLGFSVDVLPPITQQGEIYSSTRIRRFLAEGKVAEVVDLLGRHFTLEGKVIHGAKRGAGLGFPTANLETDKEILPCPGVYAVKVKRGDDLLDGVVNIGTNPTFGCSGVSVEVHLLDFHEGIYGETLRLYFVARLRGEQRFAGPEALASAIDADVERARKILAQARVVEYREYLDCGFVPLGKDGH
ncbi:MAG TPA: bifunctional riboflavin kinase/FAD synthetase [Desulfuromonadales bacterium]|nr:bifunctional riboflavin kinase/FAD synthetase [Desulfuromonadales bacterium]